MAVVMAKGYRPDVPTITPTVVFKKNVEALKAGKRRILNEGGSASSKTYSILQVLILLAMHAKVPTLISIVSESLPHLRLGAMRDFFNILGESQDANPRWSKTLNTYTFNEHAKVEFFGAEDESKARGPRRQYLFMNEANNIPWETAKMLDMRTEVCTFCDWNPVSEFWVHSYEVNGKPVPGWIHDPTSAYIHSTYKDAIDVLPKSVVETLESYRDRDPATWSIYGLGLLGQGLEGLVYPSFSQVEQLPVGNYFYGLDFGFNNDPCALVKNVIIGDALYSQELIYERGLTNDMLARKMDLLKVKPHEPIYADAAEPKSIEEIRLKGFNIKPTEKGKGSVEYGVQKVNQYVQYWTRDSVNAIREQRNYRQIKDPATGGLTGRFTHEFSHCMDARRYAVAGMRMGPRQIVHLGGLTWRNNAVYSYS